MFKRILPKKVLIVILLILAGESVTVRAMEVITINVTEIIKRNRDKPVGVVGCWLMDSDKNRPRNTSNTVAFKEMQVGALRFPYGHLSNNYLWTSPPFSDVDEGLTPCVGSLHEDPGKWDWAVDPQTKRFIKDQDFDEFITMCKSVGAEPVICVNVMSHKYEDGPSYDILKKAAVEWVRYANKKRGYNIKYWMLGNEQDLHREILSKDEYFSLYEDFVKAMKAVDSSIATGPGLLLRGDWYEKGLTENIEMVDFITSQQYLWGATWTSGGYPTWKEFDGVHYPLLRTALSAVKKSPKPNLEILITETGVTPPSGWPDGVQNDLYRSLCWFEHCMNELVVENVKYALYWCSHSPWQGEFGDGDMRNCLENNKENSRKPTGEIIKIINENVNNNFVAVDRVSGYVRTYATYSSQKGELTIFLMNKDSKQTDVTVTTTNFTANDEYSRWVYTGNSRFDTDPTMQKKGIIALNDVGFLTTLDSLSLTIVKLYSSKNHVEEAKDNPGFSARSYNGLQSDATGQMVIYALNGKYVSKIIFRGNGNLAMKKTKLPDGLYIAEIVCDKGRFLVTFAR